MRDIIRIKTKQPLFDTAPELYGLFFEDINRSADGGIYPEMLRNRAFEDSLVPGGCVVDEGKKIFSNRGEWPGAFNHGEGMDDWEAMVPYTDIPAWYADKAEMVLEETDTLNTAREAALKVSFAAGGSIRNIGFAGVSVVTGKKYDFYAFVRAAKNCTLKISVVTEAGACLAAAEVQLQAATGGWQRVDCVLTAEGADHKSALVITSDVEAEVRFGFTSLMPEDTYMGHGLRTDLIQALADTNPGFMRFPGGCIVEGVSIETAMRFSHTIGPVWERPSHNLMWHYRTTNGLGFHEYLQLCEDLQMEAMYVCNCGMSCQARIEELFNEEQVEDFLQEALHALEYALGSADTEFGAKRAAAGHPEPFTLKYVEIGNENWGPAYYERYQKFYEALKAAYPEVIYIANCHVEDQGLTAEIVDEHYYDAPEWFLENDSLFDSYDRQGPDIFLGEYAVNGGKTIASMECAMAEAVFLAGMEKNQDLVRLSAYAPLFQNSDYTAWKPNLIVFDNHQVYGIPSYHAIKLMAQNRGDRVLATEASVENRPSPRLGLPGLMSNGKLEFKNVKINGRPVDITRVIYGDYDAEDRECGTAGAIYPGGKPHKMVGKSDTWNKAFRAFIDKYRPGEAETAWCLFGETEAEEYVFEADLKFDPSTTVTMSIWNSHPGTDAGCNEPRDPDWHRGNVRNRVWQIKDGMGATTLPRFAARKPVSKTALSIKEGEFNHFRIAATHYGYFCYLNGEPVQQELLPLHPIVYHVATDTDEEVILKLINVDAAPRTIDIALDCSVCGNAVLDTLSGTPEMVNSFEDPERASVHTKEICLCEGTTDTISVELEAGSVNVLRLKKA